MDAAEGTVSGIRLLLQLFIIIQQARGFEDEFERYQLHLQMQLANCSSLIQNMDNSRNSLATHAWILSAIRDVLLKAQREAAKVNAVCTATGLPLLESNACTTTTTLNLETLQARKTGFLGKRRVQAAKTIEGIKWALYKRNMHDKFVKDISVLMQDLERQVGRELLAPGDARIMHMHKPWFLSEAEYSST